MTDIRMPEAAKSSRGRIISVAFDMQSALRLIFTHISIHTRTLIPADLRQLDVFPSPSPRFATEKPVCFHPLDSASRTKSHVVTKRDSDGFIPNAPTFKA